ncbi:hypothetical protein [Streptomyces jumonjinensis]|uniref:Uncharacterized protein n=1 Tax=Streptomyces jumonjinensis TaxID=1945 RepID=A0A646KRY1_STRJU|nr:hypothetical protein [Streptomyces jumonjinensis]MQT05099.1 hypothetical protein [Streptomyces jumonjinensis]
MSIDTTTTTPATDEPREYLTGLEPTRRNMLSAIKAVARITELGWEPRGGYPGSDVLWKVRCRLCGWIGLRFFSHLRRGRPAFRHPGCLPQPEHAKRIAALVEDVRTTCACPTPHPITAGENAADVKAIADARTQGGTDQVNHLLARLTGICPAAAARAEAAAEYAAR